MDLHQGRPACELHTHTHTHTDMSMAHTHRQRHSSHDYCMHKDGLIVATLTDTLQSTCSERKTHACNHDCCVIVLLYVSCNVPVCVCVHVHVCVCALRLATV